MAPLAAPAAPPASPRGNTPAEYDEASHSQYTYSYDEEEPVAATPAARPRAAPGAAPRPGAAPARAPVPGEPYEAYYDLSQYQHYEQPATDDAASQALFARLNLDGDGKPRT